MAIMIPSMSVGSPASGAPRRSTGDSRLRAAVEVAVRLPEVLLGLAAVVRLAVALREEPSPRPTPLEASPYPKS